MRVLIAPDKFKGSLDAAAVAENIALGFREAWPEAEAECVPLADGGEGTAEIIGRAWSARWRRCPARDALGRPIEARYVWLEEQKRAVLEASEAVGLWRVSPTERDPMRAHSFGLGEMMLDAVRAGAAELIIGLGGSATNDGGFGMARALGWRFFAGERELADGPAQLLELTRIKAPTETESAGRSLNVIGATDVRNPLLGERGAARVFAPQKGASPEQVVLLENALGTLATVVQGTSGRDLSGEPAAGAAGGLGFGLRSFCGAELRAGFDVVAEAVGLAEKIAAADVIITGEGRLDVQTVEGKTPAGVARFARKHGKPVYAIAGTHAGGRGTRAMFDGVVELCAPDISTAFAIENAATLLRERAAQLGDIIRSKASV